MALTSAWQAIKSNLQLASDLLGGRRLAASDPAARFAAAAARVEADAATSSPAATATARIRAEVEAAAALLPAATLGQLRAMLRGVETRQAELRGAELAHEHARLQMAGESEAHRRLLQMMEAESAPIQQAVTSGRATLVQFYAPWCLSCKLEARDMLRLKRRYGDLVNFVVVNGDDARNSELVSATAEHRCRTAPTWR